MYLTTLRFHPDMLGTAERTDGEAVRQAAGGPQQPGFTLGRLYAVEGDRPEYLAWHEAPDAGPAQRQPASPEGGAAGERMNFRLMRDVGDAAVTDAPWLYIVHTDIPDDIVDEYNAWYDEEHLPRLVTVPGVPRARRYTALDGNPRYLTAYELTDRDAFSSPEGLKARKTPWTERMRSLFFNTRRLTCSLVVASTEQGDPRMDAARLLLNSTER
jgi:hypothetical protein